MNASTKQHELHCPAVVPHDQWLTARKALLKQERELTHFRDRIAAERRALPWERLEEPYVFDAPEGRRTLADLFEGRRQLVVQHFMLGPGWEHGCPSCSYMADHTDGMTPHLAARDTTFVAVSRAPLEEIERFRSRMGWKFTWVSSHASDFNFDFGVSFTPEQRAREDISYNYGTQPMNAEELPGISAFIRDDAGAVFHTYSTYGRGVEAMMGTYMLLDLTALGRHEEGLSFPMAWVKHHDRYEMAAAAKAQAHSCCGERA